MCKLAPVVKQFCAIVCCNLLTLALGCVTGWATINFNELQHANTTMPTGPLSLEEASLVVSVANIGGFIGNFAIIPIIKQLGVKRTIHMLCVPLILSTILIIYAKHVYFMYASRLLSGFVSGSLVLGIPTLVNDISHDSVRGALNSLFDPNFNVGVIISFFLGNYLNCINQALAQLIFPVIFFVLMFFLPESPEYWFKRNKEKQANKSLKFYKGSIAVLETVEFLEKSTNEKIEKGQCKNDEDIESNSKLTLRDFLTPQAKRAIFISFTSLGLSFTTGALTIISYVTDVFSKTGSSLSEKNSSLLVIFTQVAANLVLLNIVERINRRTLHICSSFLTAASFSLFAAYCYWWIGDPRYEWMPPFCCACIIYMSSMGLLPIPYIITMEIFPKKIRHTCIAVTVASMWIILFVLGLIFPIFLEYVGVFKCMMVMSVTCLLNAIFGIFFIPETRGKSYDEIMKLLCK